MFLRALEIKNYRSLENVSLPSLSNFNVLVGRNNSGKSSVFSALALLNNVIHGSTVNWATAFTTLDFTRSLEMRLLFDARSKDRDRLIGMLGAGLEESRRVEVHNSPLFRRIEYYFRSAATQPPNFHLR